MDVDLPLPEVRPRIDRGIIRTRDDGQERQEPRKPQRSPAVVVGQETGDAEDRAGGCQPGEKPPLRLRRRGLEGLAQVDLSPRPQLRRRGARGTGDFRHAAFLANRETGRSLGAMAEAILHGIDRGQKRRLQCVQIDLPERRDRHFAPFRVDAQALDAGLRPQKIGQGIRPGQAHGRTLELTPEKGDRRLQSPQAAPAVCLPLRRLPHDRTARRL